MDRPGHRARVRPHVTVNCAASIDGKIATRARLQVRLSSDEDMARVAALREASDAVLVGVGTVLADDPSLKRKAGGGGGLLRVVVDSKGRTPPGAKVVDGSAPTVVATAEGATATFAHAETLRVGKERVDLPALLERLHERGVRKLLVEGGGEVIQSFLAAGLVDDLYLFVADLVIGGRSAPTVADGEGHLDAERAPRARFVSAQRLEGGLLLHYRFGAGP
jgi:2,5-diamino-6-(ribosylamino)-4(3H)-pyrimidinone 5'-phosphate reductase